MPPREQVQALALTLELPELGMLGVLLGFNLDALLRPHCASPPERRTNGTAYPMKIAPGTGFYTAPFTVAGTQCELGIHVLEGNAEGGQVVLTVPVMAPTLIGTRLQEALPGRCEAPRYGNSPQGLPGAHYRMTVQRGDHLSVPLMMGMTLTLRVG